MVPAAGSCSFERTLLSTLRIRQAAAATEFEGGKSVVGSRAETGAMFESAGEADVVDTGLAALQQLGPQLRMERCTTR